MQYAVDQHGLQPNESDRDFIDAKIGLSLSRFNSLITAFNIRFEKITKEQQLVECTIHISMAKSSDILISDTSSDIQGAFGLSLARAKRSIERQLKRNNSSRVGLSSRARSD